MRILVCDCFKKEIESVLAKAACDDVNVSFFPCRCGYPGAKWSESGNMSRFFQEDNKVDILGGYCIADMKDKPESGVNLESHRLEQCFHMFAPKYIVDGYIKEGAYLLTPGWLAQWQTWIKRWGFDQTTAREFFRESTSRLLLLNTGIDEKSLYYLKEFADFVCLPTGTVDVGLDFFSLYLMNIILQRRMENASTDLNNSHKKTADYGMAMDMLNTLTGILTEPEVIHSMLDIFAMLFAPECLYYTSYKEGRPERIWSGHSSPQQDDTTIKNHADSLESEYALTESGKGFLLRIYHRGSTLGVLEMDRIAFPEYGYSDLFEH